MITTILSVLMLIVSVFLYKTANGLLIAKKREFKAITGMEWEDYEREEKRKAKAEKKAKKAVK